MSFAIKPEIEQETDFQSFWRNCGVGEGDLIITNAYVLNPALAGAQPPCDVLYQENYGGGEPNDEMIDAILKEANKKEYKRIIAVGGGTVIDISKLFVFGGGYRCKQIFEQGATLEKKRKLIAIPTTCGTGSEVTNIAIVEFKSEHTKKGLAVEALFPDQAVLIPSMLHTLPHEVFAASSIDALIHAMESFIAPKSNDFTRLFAVEAMKRILNGYQILAGNGFQQTTRNSMIGSFLQASCFAGIAFGNTGVGAVHALSYPLGAVFHIPHGRANYLMLTGVFDQYVKKGADLSKLEQILQSILGGEGDVWKQLTDLLDQVLLRTPLHETGMQECQIAEFAESVLSEQQRLLKNNPVPFALKDIEEVYRNCF